jgi:hypothetical protein
MTPVAAKRQRDWARAAPRQSAGSSPQRSPARRRAALLLSDRNAEAQRRGARALASRPRRQRRRRGATPPQCQGRAAAPTPPRLVAAFGREQNSPRAGLRDVSRPVLRGRGSNGGLDDTPRVAQQDGYAAPLRLSVVDRHPQPFGVVEVARSRNGSGDQGWPGGRDEWGARGLRRADGGVFASQEFAAAAL